MWPEPNSDLIQDGFKESDFNTYVEYIKSEFKGKITKGCFAPWMMYKDEFLGIGGHDPRFASAREDSDVFNRLVLGGFELIQSWQSFVYHLTARAGQFQHGKLTTDHSEKSKEWRILMENSTREFFRKWGSGVRHDSHMMPIISPKYNIGFVIKNCNLNVLHQLEPWCSTIYIDSDDADIYYSYEQQNTTDDLLSKVLSVNAEKTNDIIIRFDASKLTDESFNVLTNLPLIIEDSGQEPDSSTESKVHMQLGIFDVEINKIKKYEGELIKCDV